MAMKSAQQGDIAGQLETASLYREGKGTPKDLGKAEFWTQKAQQSKMAAQWKLWNSDVFLGLSPLDIAGLALKASNAVIADIDESAMRFSCADGRTADCEALKRRQ
jgi:TPR repeat protein